MKHHIWCNFQNPFLCGKDDGTPEGSCSMCVSLKKEYPPIEGDTSGELLVHEHFPNVRPVGKSTH